jgi:hypothetical protein
MNTESTVLSQSFVSGQVTVSCILRDLKFLHSCWNIEILEAGMPRRVTNGYLSVGGLIVSSSKSDNLSLKNPEYGDIKVLANDDESSAVAKA